MNWTYSIIRLQWDAWSSCNVANVNSVSKFNVSSFSPTWSPWVSYEIVSLIWGSLWWVECWDYDSTKKHMPFRPGAISFRIVYALKLDFISMKCGSLGSWRTMTRKKRKRSSRVPSREPLTFYILFNIYNFPRGSIRNFCNMNSDV